MYSQWATTDVIRFEWLHHLKSLALVILWISFCMHLYPAACHLFFQSSSHIDGGILPSTSSAIQNRNQITVPIGVCCVSTNSILVPNTIFMTPSMTSSTSGRRLVSFVISMADVYEQNEEMNIILQRFYIYSYICQRWRCLIHRRCLDVGLLYFSKNPTAALW